MKAQILDINGNKIKEITTDLFEEPIREDIIFKVIEASRIWQVLRPSHRTFERRGSACERREHRQPRTQG